MWFSVALIDRPRWRLRLSPIVEPRPSVGPVTRALHPKAWAIHARVRGAHVTRGLKPHDQKSLNMRKKLRRAPSPRFWENLAVDDRELIGITVLAQTLT